MRSVRVLEAAATEAAEAAGWYEARRNGLGAGLRSEFKLALDRLREGICPADLGRVRLASAESSGC